eukprot:8717322-Lingulodinium_polyedra.AAC.1
MLATSRATNPSIGPLIQVVLAVVRAVFGRSSSGSCARGSSGQCFARLFAPCCALLPAQCWAQFFAQPFARALA